MKVAVVHSFYRSAEPSGENAVVRDQVEALRTAGHDVQLFARMTDEFAGTRGYSLRAAATTMTGRGPSPSLGAWRPDVVHVHNTFPNWGTRWAKEHAARLVVTLHNYRSVCAAATLFRDGHDCRECLALPVLPAVRHACYRESRAQSLPLALAASPPGPLRGLPRAARRVISLNSQAQRLFADVLGRPVDLIPNFVEVPPSGPPLPASSRWAYVGRLTKEKGILELVRDLPQDQALDVFGAGPLEPDVRRAAERTDGRIAFHGVIDRAELRARLTAYQGLVVPSLWPEGLPTVVLEAMSAGLPLILSDRIAAAPELGSAGTAVTYRPQDPKSLAFALAKALRERSALTHQATQVFTRQYSREAWMARITTLYEQVAARR